MKSTLGGSGPEKIIAKYTATSTTTPPNPHPTPHLSGRDQRPQRSTRGGTPRREAVREVTEEHDESLAVFAASAKVGLPFHPSGPLDDPEPAQRHPGDEGGRHVGAQPVQQRPQPPGQE